MIRVTPAEPKDDHKWRDWCVRARLAADELLAGSVKKINEKLYKEQADLILAFFNDKCAYCEVKLSASQRRGDLDHYRPKGRVTDKSGKLVFVGKQQHPGYFWLAYEWKNLFPSCSNCNRPGGNPGGGSSGKWDKFPVADDFYAVSPADVARERPLLLNPYDDDPEEHLTFDPKTGILGFKTDRGEETINTLGLNREGLIDARRDAALSASRAWGEYAEALAREDDPRADQLEPEIARLKIGQFAAIARTVIRRGSDKMRARGLF